MSRHGAIPIVMGLLLGATAAVATPGERSLVNYPPPSPQPAPQGSPQQSPQAKGVSLKAKPKKVVKGKRAELIAAITPCGQATQNDVIELQKGNSTVASLPVGSTCQVSISRKVVKATTFTAHSPADADSQAATSTGLKVKIKKPKSDGKGQG